MILRLLQNSVRRTRELLHRGTEVGVFSGTDAVPSVAAARTFRVVGLKRETPDAVTLKLRDVAGAALHFAAGQFGIVSFMVGGEQIQRAYSFSSAPGSDSVSITVKRKPDGMISRLLNDHIREGDVVRLSGPYGRFSYPPDNSSVTELVLIAGGSGITPNMSIIETALRGSAAVRLRLLFANRSPEEIIFRERLAALAARHPQRFAVQHVLEQACGEADAFEGRLDRMVCARALASMAPADGAQYYVCGPEGMLAEVRLALAAQGIPDARVCMERFTVPVPSAASTVSAENTTVIFRRSGEVRIVDVPEATTILEAALAADLRLPFSCTLGGCGACRLRLASGTVSMKEPNCLTEAELEQGYILTCIACPRSPCEIELQD